MHEYLWWSFKLFLFLFSTKTGSGKVMSQANRFELRGRNGDVVFSADRNEIFVGAEKLTVSGTVLFSTHSSF